MFLMSWMWNNIYKKHCTPLGAQMLASMLMLIKTTKEVHTTKFSDPASLFSLWQGSKWCYFRTTPAAKQFIMMCQILQLSWKGKKELGVSCTTVLHFFPPTLLATVSSNALDKCKLEELVVLNSSKSSLRVNCSMQRHTVLTIYTVNIN